MGSLLVVEDDETITFGIQSYMHKKDFSVTCIDRVEEAQRILLSETFDMILLDWNLPDGTGYELCSYIKSKSSVPVIFLTVRDDEADIVQGLDSGADDYIVKPFQLSVLYSRINAVLRRAGSTNTANTLACGDLVLDRNRTQVWVAGQEVQLTAGEYRLLLMLLEHKNQTLTRRVLLERLWDIDAAFVNDNTLTVTMKRLREKLGNTGIIQTIRGIGYRAEDRDV
ncbi:response regulator transcription factor [Paenibacillus sp. sgz500958]|uniref:response regulator transcription factor n=1 Tax=Paenibacillus sp. sgz500958 TaxID=3242475 RepID=UPI0036D3BB71